MIKLFSLLILVLVLPFSFSYQQSYLEFELPEWEILEQRTAVQSFTKGDLYLEVRNEPSFVLDPVELALNADGGIDSERDVTKDLREVVISNDETVYIFSTISYKDETYVATLVAPLAEKGSAEKAMSDFYKTLGFASSQNFIEAPWEEELLDPEPLSATEKIRIDWSLIILIIIGLLIIYGLLKKFGVINKKTKEKPKKKSKEK